MGMGRASGREGLADGMGTGLTIQRALSLIMGWVCLVVPGVCAAATLQPGGAVTQSGAAFAVPVALGRSESEAVAAIQFEITFDATRFGFAGATAGQPLVDAGKQLQAAEVSAGRWRLVAFGFNQNVISAGVIATLQFNTLPASPAGEYLIQAENPVVSDANGIRISTQTGSGTVTIGTPTYHSSDVNKNLVIDLNELLRGIQLFNAGEYSCDAGSEDGYTVLAGPRNCTPHNSDYKDGSDWRISLTELLRLIQFFNLRGYVPSATTEDGFEPATPKHVE